MRHERGRLRGYEPSDGTFSLPPEHAAGLTDRTSPTYFPAAVFLDVVHLLAEMPDLFRSGRGLPRSAYPETFLEAMEGSAKPQAIEAMFRMLLPAADGLIADLERGVDVADVG